MTRSRKPATDERLTHYVVLRRYVGPLGPRGDDAPADVELWEPMRSEQARTSEDAIKQAALALGEAESGTPGTQQEGDWKAVPHRSWKGGGRTGNRVVPIFESLEMPQEIQEEVLA